MNNFNVNNEIENLAEKDLNGEYILGSVTDIWKNFYEINVDGIEQLLEELSVRQDMSTRITNAGPSGAAKSTATAMPLTPEIAALYHNGISPTQTSKIHNIVSCLYNDIPLTTVVIKYRNSNRILEKLMIDCQTVIADKLITSHCKPDENDIEEIVNNIITPSKAADYDLADCVEISNVSYFMEAVKEVVDKIVGNPLGDTFLEKVVNQKIEKIEQESYENIRNVYEMEITRRISEYKNIDGEVGEKALLSGILEILEKCIESVKDHMRLKLENYKQKHPNCVASMEKNNEKQYVIIFENNDLENMQAMLSDIYTNHKYSVLIEQIQYFTPANNMMMEVCERECEIHGNKLDEDGYLEDVSPINGILSTFSDTRGTDDARADGYNKNEALNGAISVIKQTNPDSTYMYFNMKSPTANFHKIYEAVKRQTKSPVKIIITHIDQFVEEYIKAKREANLKEVNNCGGLQGHRGRLTAKQKEERLLEKQENCLEKSIIKVRDFKLEEVIKAFEEINQRLKKNGFDEDPNKLVKICLVKSECQEVIDEMAKNSNELKSLIGGDGILYSEERFYKEIYNTIAQHHNKYQSVGNMQGVTISLNGSAINSLAKKCKLQHESIINSGLAWETSHNGKCGIKEEKNFYYKYRNYFPHWKTKDAVLRYNAIGEGWVSNANVYDNVDINIPALCRSFISINDIKACMDTIFDQTIRQGEQKVVKEALSKNLSSYQFELKRKISIQVCSNGLQYFGFYDFLEKCKIEMNQEQYWIDQLTMAFNTLAVRMSYVTLK